MMSNTVKAVETRVRKTAAQRGLALRKSRSRTPEHPDYGTYALVKETAPGGHWRSQELVASGMSLAEIEDELDWKVGDEIGALTVRQVRGNRYGRRWSDSQVLDLELTDGEYRIFRTSVSANKVEPEMFDAEFDFELPLEIYYPMWLMASGSEVGVHVMRSPQVRDTGTMFAPVQKFLDEHGLINLDEEIVEDRGWVFAKYVSTLYGVPDDHPALAVAK